MQSFSFDGADSFYAKTEPMTRDKFENLLNDPLQMGICKTIADIIRRRWSKVMTEAELRALKEEISPLKKSLKGVIWQAHFPNGCRNVNKEPKFEMSGLCVVDYDGIDSPKDIWDAKIAPNVQSLVILCAFVSPSLHGLKVVFRKPDNMTIAEAQRWFSEQVGMLDYFDTSGKDPARFCFMVPRSYLLHYEPEKLFDLELTPESYVVEVKEKDPSLNPALHRTMQKAGEEFLKAPKESTEVQALVEAGYHHIPYADIIKRYWDLNNDGHEPEYGDRNTKTYELALAMRHIAGFDEQVLDAIIPCYNGLPEAEKLQCIKSALSKEHSLMPQTLRSVLDSFKSEYADQPEIVSALDAVEEQAETLPYQQFEAAFKSHNKRLPMGLIDSLDGVAPGLRMPAVIGIGPMIGALATGVSLRVHDEYKHLNLVAYIVGEAGSGKSVMDSLYQIWMSALLILDAINAKILEDWKALPAKDRDKNKRPQVLIRIQPLRTSIADVLSHLGLALGLHLFSFSAEADQLSQTRKSGSYANVGVLIRLSFDGAEFKSSYAGESAVNANIEHVHWNITLCTTPDGLYRATPNVTDGEVTRLAIARTPDNTFSPLVRIKPRKESSVSNIKRVAHLLTLMKGEVELPKLQARCEAWLESVRLDALKNDDRVRANMRKRSAVIAMRYICCFMLCAFAERLIQKLDNHGSNSLPDWADGQETAEAYLQTHPNAVADQLKKFQTIEYLEAFDVVADYVLNNQLFYFRDRIQQAYDSPSYITSQRVREGANDSVFDQLPQEFTVEEARAAKGKGSSPNSVKQMLKNWVRSGLIENIERGRYRKLSK